jgi:hypothetical protein
MAVSWPALSDRVQGRLWQLTARVEQLQGHLSDLGQAELCAPEWDRNLAYSRKSHCNFFHNQEIAKTFSETDCNAGTVIVLEAKGCYSLQVEQWPSKRAGLFVMACAARAGLGAIPAYAFVF